MKKTGIVKRRISCFLIVVLLCVNFANVTAEEESNIAAFSENALSESVTLLENLFSADLLEKGNEEPVTRAEFVDGTLKLLQIPAINKEESVYSDITEENKYFDSVNTAYELGIIAQGNKFNPDDIITVPQAVKILVHAVKRQKEAETAGYPNGYLKVAYQMELLKGISYSEISKVNGGTAKVLFYNLLNAKAYTISVFSLNNTSYACLLNDIQYLQLVLEKSIDDFEVGRFTEEYSKAIKEQLGNVKIAILGSYINPSNHNDDELRTDIEKFKEKIRYASILNPIAVGTETGIYKEGLTDTEEAYQRVLGTFKELTKYAQEYNVCIAVEGVHCFVINTPQKMKRLVDNLNSPNVKVIFDPVNYLNINNYQKQDEIIREAFDLLWDKICVIHAKDFVVENGEFKAVKQTEGMLNYKLLFENMKKYNLDVPIICEEISDSDAVIAFENLEKMWRNL